MFKTLEQMKKRDERGFTLVELLIVIAIIAILAAIAIPQFAAYRVRAIEAGMVADAKNLATAQEAIFADCQAYAPIVVTGGTPIAVPVLGTCPAGWVPPQLNASQGNVATITVPAAGTFLISVANPNATRAGFRTPHTLTSAGVTSWAP